MKTVITYGSFDLFHFGHQRLLERAKKLGDYLIVGVTSDDYDKTRGKINTEQSLAERIASVKATGLADMVIVEEYDGQKIDDIKKYNVDVFAIGSDWKGIFDYLGKYTKVVYLERTKGISSSEIRSEQRALNMALVSDSFGFLSKINSESAVVNGLTISGVCPETVGKTVDDPKLDGVDYFNSFDEALGKSEAVYIKTSYEKRYDYVRKALEAGKHVLCESPICLDATQCEELFALAKKKKLILMEAIRTAYSTAYKRLALLAEIGKIGQVVSVEATCTDMLKNDPSRMASLFEWGANALLPVFQILGTDFRDKKILSHFDENGGDVFTKIYFTYPTAVASIFVAEGAKAEGELVIAGTDGYIYVPAPWWKTEYFEIRYEDQTHNRRYFYQLDGEGIRYELVEFLQAIKAGKDVPRIDRKITMQICNVMHDFCKKKDLVKL